MASTVVDVALGERLRRLLPKLQRRDGDVLRGLLGFIGLHRVGEELRELLVQGALFGLVDLQQALAELNQRLVGSGRAARGTLGRTRPTGPAIRPSRPAFGSGQDADEIEHRVSHLRPGENLAACLRLVVGGALGGGGIDLAPVDAPVPGSRRSPRPGSHPFRPVVATMAPKLLRLVDDVADQAQPAVLVGERSHDIGIGRVLARTRLVSQVDQFGGTVRHLGQQAIVLLGRGRQPPELGRVEPQIILGAGDRGGLFGRARSPR